MHGGVDVDMDSESPYLTLVKACWYGNLVWYISRAKETLCMLIHIMKGRHLLDKQVGSEDVW